MVNTVKYLISARDGKVVVATHSIKGIEVKELETPWNKISKNTQNNGLFALANVLTSIEGDTDSVFEIATPRVISNMNTIKAQLLTGMTNYATGKRKLTTQELAIRSIVVQKIKDLYDGVLLLASGSEVHVTAKEGMEYNDDEKLWLTMYAEAEEIMNDSFIENEELIKGAMA